MSRISALFERKKHRILNVYVTAGYPAADSTVPVMQSLQAHGADMIELGMPYSDPLADGPVIQASSARSLENGMTIARLFEQLASFRERINVPVILMGYMNPVIQYGFEAFCRQAKSVGVDGLILPDLPMYEFEKIYGSIIGKYGLDFIFLVTPETSEARIRKLDALSTGFIYAVSSSATTGHTGNQADQRAYFGRLKKMELKNPVLIGFGIKDRETFDAASEYASGAIIGTAYIRALETATDTDAATKSFLSAIV